MDTGHAELQIAKSWPHRLGRWSIWLTLAAIAIAAIGLTMARYDWIPKLSGFYAFLGGALVCLLAALLGLAALIGGRKHAAQGRGRVLLAVAVSLLFVGFLVSRPLVAGTAPAIHDVTTDLADPPPFKTIAVRADNLVGVGTEANWRRIHAAAYGYLGPVTIAKPVELVAADAVRLAQEAGWQVVMSDPARGHIEATASMSYIRFYDDVVIRITPTTDGTASRVDMRSVSRVGVSDLGVNARRIRAFLAELAAA